MSTKNKKKTGLTILFIIIGVLILAISVFFIWDSIERKKYSEAPNAEPYTNQIQYYYGAVGCMYLMDKNNIPVDEQYKADIKEKCQQIINDLDKNDVSLLHFSRIIAIDNYFNFGNAQDYFFELEDYYDEKRSLFSSDKISKNVDYVDFTEDDMITLEANASIELFNTLNYFEIKYEYHDLVKMLADFFNKNRDKFDVKDLDSEDRVYISDPITFVFYDLLETGNLNLIEYDEVWAELEKSIKSETAEENTVPSIGDVFETDTTLKLNKTFDIDLKTKYPSVQKLYELLNSEEAFEYDKENELFPLMTFSNFSSINDLDLSKNTYFTEHINKWLKDNLKEYLKNKQSYSL